MELLQEGAGAGGDETDVEIEEKREGCDWKTRPGVKIRPGRNQGCTSCRALWSEGDVIQGDVGPHVSAHLALKGHPERCRVGQDDTGVRPLVTVISSCCPHLQFSPIGSNSVDLERKESK